ncbi:MAG: hypothetical protein G01um101420_492 [Parcubacteria group bacterium Gr01-1014_20]|nr:MAG: hypothetical protein G01um101420_492 [Parcubacteria group bacterium Gr01-1014_20]
MAASIEKIRLNDGDSICISLKGSTEVSVCAYVSNGQFLIQGPINSNNSVLSVTRDGIKKLRGRRSKRSMLKSM